MNFSTKSAIVRSFAKVNLTLDVLGTRPDGYHAIESVMQTVGLHDTISLSVREDGEIRLSCDMPGIPTDESNLAWRAASVLLEAQGKAAGLDIRIEKRIPAQAGLGGGSSNAAAVLRGLDHLLGLSVSADEMCAIAARIGSDVPFFLVGGTAFVCGRGEEVQPLPDILPVPVVIVKPPFGVSTPWSYRRLDEMRAIGDQSLAAGERQTASRHMVECVRRSAVCSLKSRLANDLEAPAVEQHPEIAGIKAALIESGARAGLMCGSGSAVFGLFETEAQARTAADNVVAVSPCRPCQVFVTRSVAREEALGIE